MSKEHKVDFAAGANQIIRVQPTEYRGKKYVDVRKFFDKEGEWTPTGKGISIPLDDVEGVAKAILRMKAAHSLVEEETTEYYSAMEFTEANHFLAKKAVVIFDEDELVESAAQAKNTFEPESDMAIVKLKLKRVKGTELHCWLTKVLYIGDKKDWRTL